MIFAAGLGTRLKHLTDRKPKALVEVQNKSLLEIAISKLSSFGFDDIIVNVHHFSDQVIEFLEANKFDANISISDESENLLDTGGGLFKACDFFNKNEAFLIYNVDIISDIDLKKMYNSHNDSNALITLAVRNRLTSRYLMFDDKENLAGWKNIKTAETIMINQVKEELISLAFSGIQIVDPKIFELYNRNGKFSIIDVLLELAKSHSIKAFIHDDDFWIDLGKPESLRYAENWLINNSL